MTLLVAVFLALVLFFGQRKLFGKNWKRKLHVSLAFGEQGGYPGELCTLIYGRWTKADHPYAAVSTTMPRKIFDRADSNSCTGFFYEQKICGRLAGRHDDLCISKTVIHEAVIEPQ